MGRFSFHGTQGPGARRRTIDRGMSFGTGGCQRTDIVELEVACDEENNFSYKYLIVLDGSIYGVGIPVVLSWCSFFSRPCMFHKHLFSVFSLILLLAKEKKKKKTALNL